jgi:hypothetical protein
MQHGQLSDAVESNGRKTIHLYRHLYFLHRVATILQQMHRNHANLRLAEDLFLISFSLTQDLGRCLLYSVTQAINSW